MNEPRFKRGDIVLSVPPFDQEVFVILDVNPDRPKNWYSAIRPDNNQRFHLSDEALIKIGEATQEYLDKEGEVEPVKPLMEEYYLRGKMRAAREAMFASGDDAKRWTILAHAKPGDLIKVHLAGGLTELKFCYVLERGKKYVFLAEDRQGKRYKYTLHSVCPGGMGS